MPKYPISLDESVGVTIEKMDGPRKHFPTLHLHWDKPYDLPDDGTMVVKFHKSREVNTESDDGVSQSVDLEILTIESVKADKESPKRSARDEAEENLDKIASELEDEGY